ncbi:zinc finger E-box-binding homeobox 2-like [Rhodnius prolixus]|uniref:zinc finger E-box-binding homeobox 2-like n=1 Tax=Rhodnius prolixus TaxID=13249 RepID=UPI003D1897D0
MSEVFRRRYLCKACGKSYKYKNGLNSHIKYECGQTPQFHCPYCPHSSHQKSNLKVHLVKKHRMTISFNDDSIHPVVDVENEFINTYIYSLVIWNLPVALVVRRLKRRIMEEDKIYRCSACNKSYVYKAGLSRHQKYECGKEPQFQCPHCPYRAKIKSNLTAHVAYKHMNFR